MERSVIGCRFGEAVGSAERASAGGKSGHLVAGFLTREERWTVLGTAEKYTISSSHLSNTSVLM